MVYMKVSKVINSSFVCPLTGLGLFLPSRPGLICSGVRVFQYSDKYTLLFWDVMSSLMFSLERITLYPLSKHILYLLSSRVQCSFQICSSTLYAQLWQTWILHIGQICVPSMIAHEYSLKITNLTFCSHCSVNKVPLLWWPVWANL